MVELSSLNITLSENAVQFVQDAVSTGEYASASDVLQTGLHMLQDELEQRRRWEREVVVPAYYRHKADPSSALSLAQVDQYLQERRGERRDNGSTSMPVKVVFSPDSRAQLSELETYLAERFYAANAARYVQRITGACVRLGAAPQAG